LLIENVTCTELSDEIATSKTTAIYCAATTDRAGPAIAFRRHVFVARYLAPIFAARLG